MVAEYEGALAERLPPVREGIARAAERSGRDADAVRLVAITKGHSPAAVEAALAAGLRDLGENRVEELEAKAAAFRGRDVCWHMVGRLQRRKVPRLFGVCDLLHSVGDVRLAQRISERWAARREAADSRAGSDGGDRIDDGGGAGPGPGPERFPVLLQVNTSGEEVKGGFALERAEEEVAEVLELPGLRVDGLMTMAPYTDDERVLRRTFRRLRELHEALCARGGYHGRELSMGMTNDYTIAVEEGSTMVRLGTALFGERPT